MTVALLAGDELGKSDGATRTSDILDLYPGGGSTIPSQNRRRSLSLSTLRPTVSTPRFFRR
jgi:hypothetical protein